MNSRKHIHDHYPHTDHYGGSFHVNRNIHFTRAYVSMSGSTDLKISVSNRDESGRVGQSKHLIAHQRRHLRLHLRLREEYQRKLAWPVSAISMVSDWHGP